MSSSKNTLKGNRRRVNLRANPIAVFRIKLTTKTIGAPRVNLKNRNRISLVKVNLNPTRASRKAEVQVKVLQRKSGQPGEIDNNGITGNRYKRHNGY